MSGMLRRLWQQQLARPEEFAPSRDDFEVVGVFNPGVIATDEGVRLMLRIAERPRRRRQGMVGLPRWQGGELTVDWTPEEGVEWLDPRVVRLRSCGDVRLSFASHLRVATSGDGRKLDTLGSVPLVPEHEWEEYGIEDARITQLEGRYYITYVAVSRHGAATALASTADFIAFRRHGVLFPPENKDVLLFPERIGGRYAAIHRPNPATPFCPPEMWLAWSDNLIDWGRHEPLAFAASEWESGRVGGGCPPLAADGGWLEIYHGNRKPRRAGEVGQYTAAALLLDRENPARVHKRTRGPILAPEADFEREGFVPGVVFPTGLVECGQTLLIYYGAADTSTGVVEVSRKELMEALA